MHPIRVWVRVRGSGLGLGTGLGFGFGFGFGCRVHHGGDVDPYAARGIGELDLTVGAAEEWIRHDDEARG